MRSTLYILVFFLLSGCAWLTPKEELKAAYVAAQLKTIDWEVVDQFPLFNNCDETATKTQQKTCFEGLIKAELAQLIQEMNAIDSLSFSGNFTLSILVDTKGSISIEDPRSPPFELSIYEYFKSKLHGKFAALPPLAPALKQGIPVATRFQIPVEIHLD
jgi:hypothetical protein